ncbi:MAG: D-ribose ABC transporter substrate-binding protein [Actinomycetota bacterium]|nr:D-ribose ABC transporter substrate-binding protein [Actinomycetota bacterium]
MRTRARMLLAVLLLAVLATALAAGCQRGGGEGGGARIGLSVSTLNNPFFVTLQDGAQSAADEAGAELIVSDAQNDTAQQQDDIQNFVSQQVNAILVNPVDSDAVVPAIEAANQANIPVIALDRGASGGELATTIASDNVQGGNLAGEELIRLVGSGSVAQLEGTPGADPARDRGQGFQDAIDAQSAVEVVASQSANFDRAEGLNVAENILQANPDIAGIFAQNDEMALGAVQALGDSAGDDVKVVGFDATEDGLSAIQDGTMNATVAQQPAEIGSLGVENAISVINGESVEENIPVEVQLVTPENVSDFL